MDNDSLSFGEISVFKELLLYSDPYYDLRRHGMGIFFVMIIENDSAFVFCSKYCGCLYPQFTY